MLTTKVMRQCHQPHDPVSYGCLPQKKKKRSSLLGEIVGARLHALHKQLMELDHNTLASLRSGLKEKKKNGVCINYL